MEMSLAARQATAEAVALKAKLFRGLADSSRLAVLEALRDGPACVSDVVAATRQSQPSVSMHLACLWECGLVERERQGRFVQYRIADPRVMQLLDAANALLLHVGDQVYVCTRYEAAAAHRHTRSEALDVVR